MTETNAAVPGWYPDPADASLQRYWDGAQWTEHTAPGATSTGGGSKAGLWIGLAIGGFMLLTISMLAAVAIPLFLSQREKAEDAAAKADVSVLGREISIYFVDNVGGPPSVEAVGGYYYVDGREVSYQSDNVELGGVTGTDSTNWCVWVTNPAGEYAPDGYQYSAWNGLEQGRC